jgi:hypothetical protein
MLRNNPDGGDFSIPLRFSRNDGIKNVLCEKKILFLQKIVS